MEYTVNYNEEFGCWEVLEWSNGWKETGMSYETEWEALEALGQNE